MNIYTKKVLYGDLQIKMENLLFVALLQKQKIQLSPYNKWNKKPLRSLLPSKLRQNKLQKNYTTINSHDNINSEKISGMKSQER